MIEIYSKACVKESSPNETPNLQFEPSYVEDAKELNVFVPTKVSPDDKIKEKV